MKMYHLTLDLTHPVTGKELHLNLKGWMEDCGIGAYEFWGSHGTHHQWEPMWEIVDANVPDEEVYDDEKLCQIIDEKVGRHIEEAQQGDYREEI